MEGTDSLPLCSFCSGHPPLEVHTGCFRGWDHIPWEEKSRRSAGQAAESRDEVSLGKADLSPTRLWPDECSSGEGGLLQAPGAAGCQRTASLRQPCLFLSQDRAHLGNPGVCGQCRVPETPARQGRASRVPRARNLRRCSLLGVGQVPHVPWVLAPLPAESSGASLSQA